MPASVPAMTRRATSVPVRLARILRLVAHVARGLWVVHTRYAALPAERQDDELRRWAERAGSSRETSVFSGSAAGC